jgi:hypothetical protein
VSDAAPGIDGCARFELAIPSDASHVHTEALVEAAERLAIDDLTRVGNFDRVTQFVAQRHKLIGTDLATRDLDDDVPAPRGAANEREASRASLGEPPNVDIDDQIRHVEAIDQLADRC